MILNYVCVFWKSEWVEIRSRPAINNRFYLTIFIPVSGCWMMLLFPSLSPCPSCLFHIHVKIWDVHNWRGPRCFLGICLGYVQSQTGMNITGCWRAHKEFYFSKHSPFTPSPLRPFARPHHLQTPLSWSRRQRAKDTRNVKTTNQKNNNKTENNKTDILLNCFNYSIKSHKRGNY